MEREKIERSPLRRSLIVVLIYLLAGAIWITFSDAMVEAWFPDIGEVTHAQTYKGLLFVFVTGLILYLSLYRQFRRDREQLELRAWQRREIRQLSQFRESVIDNASVWINVLDPEARVVLWNKAAEQISGYSRKEVLGKSDLWALLYPDEDYRRKIFETASEILVDQVEVEGFESTIRTRSGKKRRLSWNSRSFRSEDGQLAGSIAIAIDITEQYAAEKALKQRERQLETFMDNLPGMAYRCLYDEFWSMKFVSSACRELTGYEPEELLDNRKVAFADLIESSANEELVHSVEAAIGAAEPFSLEYELVRKDGRHIWVWERGRAVESDGPLVLEGIILDITDRKVLENELSEMATHDTLTGLFNRRETSRLLGEELARADRYRRPLSLCWIDLDYFKAVNDRYGHAAGDRVLQVVCRLMADSIRSLDVIGRYGGEEFVVVLPEMDQEEALAMAERLRILVAETEIKVDDTVRVQLTISIGVAVYPVHGRSAELLCAAADQAMYAAKAAGRNQVCLADGQSQSAGES